MNMSRRFAIVTPYHKETPALLRRCIDSVRAQSVSADHILVADGHPQDWVDGEHVRHIRLDREHGDYGNTPRGIGALLAIGGEYDGIGLLDADNWLDADHIEKCLDAARTDCGSVTHCDYVIARRRFMRPDETEMPLGEEPSHVDTNCFFFLRGSFDAVPYWATMPKAVSKVCDRVFYHMLQKRPYKAAHVKTPSVNYHSLWAANYLTLGEDLPPDAKANINLAEFTPWIRSLSLRDINIVNRLSGFDLIKKTMLMRKRA